LFWGLTSIQQQSGQWWGTDLGHSHRQCAIQQALYCPVWCKRCFFRANLMPVIEKWGK